MCDAAVSILQKILIVCPEHAVNTAVIEGSISLTKDTSKNDFVCVHN